MLFNHVVFSFQIVLSSWLKYVMKEQNEQNEQKIIFSFIGRISDRLYKDFTWTMSHLLSFVTYL